MGYKYDSYIDVGSDDDKQSSEPYNPDELLDKDFGDWVGRQRSQTPVYDAEASESLPKPRKRLIIKGLTAKETVPSNLEEEGKRKKRFKGALLKTTFSGKGMKDQDGDVKEMWETIASADFEAEEDEEIEELFKMGKKKNRNEKSHAEIALLVENVLLELEVTAEVDADLNRQGKPAINKLKKLPLLIDSLSKKQLQLEFLDHGVLTLLKNWLEPLPDGSLPNINIREAILKILTEFPIDLEQQHDRREQLKKSGLGKVIMFLSKSDEETTSNKKLAKDLVDKWSRSIFNKSTRFEDMRNTDDNRVPCRRPMLKKPGYKAAGIEYRDEDLDFDEFSKRRKPVKSSSRQHVSRPEATLLNFVVRPQSKINPDEIRARAKQAVRDQRREKINKKLQKLKAPKRKQLQATKLSAWKAVAC